MESNVIAFCIAVVALTLVAAVVDWRTRRLPNWLTVPAFLIALVFHATVGHGVLFSLGGFAVGFGILLVLMMVGGGGGGDVKLMGAIGAWLGAKLILCVFLLSALLVAIVGLVTMLSNIGKSGMGYLFRMKKQIAAASKGANEAKTLRRGRLVTYAIPVALSTWLVLVWQILVQWKDVFPAE